MAMLWSEQVQFLIGPAEQIHKSVQSGGVAIDSEIIVVMQVSGNSCSFRPRFVDLAETAIPVFLTQCVR